MSKLFTSRQAQHTVRLDVVSITAVRVSGPEGEKKTNFVQEFIGLQIKFIFGRGCGSVHILRNKLCYKSFHYYVGSILNAVQRRTACISMLAPFPGRAQCFCAWLRAPDQ